MRQTKQPHKETDPTIKDQLVRVHEKSSLSNSHLKTQTLIEQLSLPTEVTLATLHTYSSNLGFPKGLERKTQMESRIREADNTGVELAYRGDFSCPEALCGACDRQGQIKGTAPHHGPQ